MNASVAFFAMADENHFQRLRAIISGVVRQGATARVFTHSRFAPAVAEAGAEFVDMFTRYPLEAADDESIPIVSRYVTYAACYAESIARELGAAPPSVIVADTFSVIGRVVAAILEVPFVNVCAGHNMTPARVSAEVAVYPRVHTSERCHRAVEILRDGYGIADASPFSYASGLSPWLNLYCEPSAFLTAEERKVFEPIAFFGSLPERSATTRHDPYFGDSSHRSGGALKIYASFGTIIWRHYSDVAIAALTAIADSVATLPDAELVVSLGRSGNALRSTLPNVTVLDYVDQDAVLREADVFISHQGMNSTHEAILHTVPMISYPFFWDQPSLAAKCATLGIARPLTDAVRGPITAAGVGRTLRRVVDARVAIRERLREVRQWEMETIAGREEILERIVSLSPRV